MTRQNIKYIVKNVSRHARGERAIIFSAIFLVINIALSLPVAAYSTQGKETPIVLPSATPKNNFLNNIQLPNVEIPNIKVDTKSSTQEVPQDRQGVFNLILSISVGLGKAISQVVHVISNLFHRS